MPDDLKREGRSVPVPGVGAREHQIAREPNPLLKWVRVAGPGVVSGASDDDPSGVGTYAVAGATLGFGTLWTILMTLPMMIATQFIASKVGMVTGKGLTAVMREHYPRTVWFPAICGLAVANTINAGADIGAIAAAINLLAPLPIAVLIVPISVVIVSLQIWGSYRLIARIFKWIALALFAYVGAALYAKPHLADLLRGTFVPTLRFDRTLLAVLVALLGTTISPYLWFWQADQEVEELIAIGQRRLWQRRGATNRELTYAAWDVNLGMFFSNIIAYCIIVTAAATLFAHGATHITSASQAAEALRPFLGRTAPLLFALGLIGAGFLAVPILTASTAYALAQAFGWRYGLHRPPRGAKEFYSAIVAATLIGMLVNFAGINPIDALFWAAIVNGVITPPLLILLMLVSNNRAVMGRRVNGAALNVLGWATAALMSAAVIALFATWGS